MCLDGVCCVEARIILGLAFILIIKTISANRLWRAATDAFTEGLERGFRCSQGNQCARNYKNPIHYLKYRSWHEHEACRSAGAHRSLKGLSFLVFCSRGEHDVCADTDLITRFAWYQKAPSLSSPAASRVLSWDGVLLRGGWVIGFPKNETQSDRVFELKGYCQMKTGTLVAATETHWWVTRHAVRYGPLLIINFAVRQAPNSPQISTHKVNIIHITPYPHLTTRSLHAQLNFWDFDDNK